MENQTKQTAANPNLSYEWSEIQKSANGGSFSDSPIERLAVAVAKSAKFSMKINRAVQHGVMDGIRNIVNIASLKKALENPLDSAGAPVRIHTAEQYKIYNCLKIMPHCIKSMEITRGDHDGKIGENRPLENTICVTVHHLDDKTYGGLCVLREWGATDMVNVFVGYNPLQTNIWRSMVDDIPDTLFTSCILESIPQKDAPSWAEGIYRIARSVNKFPASRMLPSDAFDRIFDGTDTARNSSGQPLAFLYAQRSLCAYNFLHALARAHLEHKQLFIWEDGGYLNPIIDQAMEDGMSIAEFRSLHMIPDDEWADGILPDSFGEAVKDIFIGSVELTRNGYDNSAAISENRPMNTRLFSGAASYEKIMLEGDSITLSCIEALSQVMYSTGYSLRNRHVLVMGARGNLGRLSAGHLADILECPEKQLWGCDLKLNWPAPEPDSIPKWAEWSACDRPLEHVGGEVAAYKELPEEVRYDIDVILGWTGGPRTVVRDGKEVRYQTIDGQDIADWLTRGRKKANLYLASGSTKTTEYSDVLKWLETLLNQPEKERTVNGILLDGLTVEAIPDELSIAAVQQMWPDDNPPDSIARNFGTRFRFQFQQDGQPVTKTLYLVNNTMPINFMYYGTPTEIMDMTYAQVTSCAAALLKNRDTEPGIYPTDYRRKATEGVYLGRRLDKEYGIPSSI